MLRASSDGHLQTLMNTCEYLHEGVGEGDSFIVMLFVHLWSSIYSCLFVMLVYLFNVLDVFAIF